jgi:hypothetical protein
MGTTLAIEGESLELSCQLKNQAATKFLRAVLLKADASQASGSPVALDNVGFGRYTKPYTMPAHSVQVVYEVYEDSGFSSKAGFTAGEDTFILSIKLAEILTRITNIEANILNLKAGEATAGRLDNVGTLNGIISGLGELKAKIDPLGQLSSKLEPQAELSARMKTQQIEGEIDGC